MSSPASHPLGDGRQSRQQIVDAPRGQIQDYTWAPRGAHLAFSMNGPNGFGSVYVWSEKDGQVRRVTDPLFNAGRGALRLGRSRENHCRSSECTENDLIH